MVDVTELLVHWHAGRSQSELAASLGLDRKTVRKYLAPAIAAGIVPGDTTRSLSVWDSLVAGWFPDLVDGRLRQVTWPAIEAHRDYIVESLRAGVTKGTIHQRLRDEHGLEASCASLKRWIAANLAEEVNRSRVTVLRGEVAPGSEAQIDYGYLGSWTDPASGRVRRVWAFVMVLACSRMMFLRPVLTMDQAAWTRAHVEAFAFFGGVPARLVPDNLRTGVERADLYDPKINRSYAELAAHYGVLIDPARAAKPKDKARVERPMPYCRDSFFRGRSFTSLAAMQAEAVRWSSEVARHAVVPSTGGRGAGEGVRRARGPGAGPVAGRAVRARALVTGQGRPGAPRAARRHPHQDRPDPVFGAWRFIGATVDTRTTADGTGDGGHGMVQIFTDGELIATHAFLERGKRTDMGHYLPEKIAFHMRTPTWCREKAGRIGPATAEVVATMLVDNALFRQRAAQGVLGLADKHGQFSLEAAAAKALAAGDPSYRTIKGILAAGLESDPLPAPTGDGGLRLSS
ncbi:IS21 family transposase [Sporichthya polymorpha]|uniref:IS21 family transposase n=1 Tax=Sporichthya polymorpha TaxID=35751 RepID=UPI001B7FEF10|nr:IS21 family transposase [Sporichthya polymorpha]